MERVPLSRLTIRAAVILGFAVTAGLWGFTGFTFTRRMAEAERESAEVTTRYMRAQELLADIRAQVLVSSVILRDALLDTDPAGNLAYERRLERRFSTIEDSLRAYVPVLDTLDERAEIQRLRDEMQRFRETTSDVLRADDGTANVRSLLNDRIVPRREATVRVSEEVQTLNRRAFIQQQTITAAIHRETEQLGWRGLGLSLVASLGIALLATLYAGRLENRLRRQREKEAETARELQRLSSKLLSAQEDERRTIARELHDEVGQALTAVQVDLSLAQKAVTDEAARGMLVDAQEIAEGALRSIRDISQLLHPSVLDDLGLPVAVERYLKGFSRRHGVAIDLTQDGMEERLGADVEVSAYRIIQEALTNVARHAQATRATVSLRRRGATLQIVVEDDGRGFDPAPGAAGASGLGLIGIRERAAQHDGSMTVHSSPGRGTRMCVELAVSFQAPVALEAVADVAAVASLQQVRRA